MSAVGPAHRAQEQDHAGRTAHNSPTEVGSIRCHLTRGSLFIPLGLSGPLAQTPESSSAPSAPGPASGAAYGSSPGGKLGHRPPRLIPHFSSPAPVALAGLLATLPQPNVLLLLLAPSLPLSSPLMHTATAAVHGSDRAHPAQQITAFAGCQLTKSSCEMHATCSHLHHLAALCSPPPGPAAPLAFTDRVGVLVLEFSRCFSERCDSVCVLFRSGKRGY